MGNVSSIIGDVISYVKQNEIEKAQKLLDEQFNIYRTEEVKEKRTQVAEINRSIVQIDIELKKLEIQYTLIQSTVPGAMLKTIDQYINELKTKRIDFQILKKRKS
jgi:hypothetical protein